MRRSGIPRGSSRTERGTVSRRAPSGGIEVIVGGHPPPGLRERWQRPPARAGPGAARSRARLRLRSGRERAPAALARLGGHRDHAEPRRARAGARPLHPRRARRSGRPAPRGGGRGLRPRAALPRARAPRPPRAAARGAAARARARGRRARRAPEPALLPDPSPPAARALRLRARGHPRRDASALLQLRLRRRAARAQRPAPARGPRRGRVPARVAAPVAAGRRGRVDRRRGVSRLAGPLRAPAPVLRGAAMTGARGLGERISVCLLAYNHVGLIDSTLRSILAQTLDGYEILVSDDCSTDGTWERIQALAAEDGRIRPIRTPRNLGMAANANFAVAQATRAYVALLHHDDLYREDLLERWAAVLERHAEVVFVFNEYVRHATSERFAQPIEGGRIDGRVFLETYLLPSWGCPVRGTAMVRREAWESLGGMRERFGLLADVDLWMRLARIGAVGYVDAPLIAVRHERPTYYPAIYKGEFLSWERQRLLFEIHAVNRLETLDRGSPSARLRWWRFRVRLSVESLRWIAYAVVKRRRDLIATCRQAETPWDLPGLGLLRRMLEWTAAGIGAAGGGA